MYDSENGVTLRGKKIDVSSIFQSTLVYKKKHNIKNKRPACSCEPNLYHSDLLVSRGVISWINHVLCHADSTVTACF